MPRLLPHDIEAQEDLTPFAPSALRLPSCWTSPAVEHFPCCTCAGVARLCCTAHTYAHAAVLPVLSHKMRHIAGDPLLLPPMHTARHRLQSHERTAGPLPHPAHAMGTVYERSTADILSSCHCPVAAFLLSQHCISPPPKTGVCSLVGLSIEGRAYSRYENSDDACQKHNIF